MIQIIDEYEECLHIQLTTGVTDKQKRFYQGLGFKPYPEIDLIGFKYYPPKR